MFSAAEDFEVLQRRWAEATVAALRAQQDYCAVAQSVDADDAAFDLAWLRLWRAEQRQREAEDALDDLSS